MVESGIKHHKSPFLVLQYTFLSLHMFSIIYFYIFYILFLLRETVINLRFQQYKGVIVSNTTYFRYIVAVSFIVEGNHNTL